VYANGSTKLDQRLLVAPVPPVVYQSSDSVPVMKSGNEIVMDQSMRRETDPQPPADEWFDIFRDGLLKKKVLQPGGGTDSWPQVGQIVKISLITRLLDGTLVEELPEFWFTLGNKEVILALDVAVRLMGMGEKALIQTDERYAYGLSGNLYPEIPSGADLSLEVKLLEAIDAPDLKLLSPTEKIALATCKKEQGNVLYLCRAYDFAIQKYEAAMEITESISEDDISSEEENKLMELKVKCLNNMAASMMKLEQYDAALTCYSAMLIYQPENVKALFHTGKVLVLHDKYSEAIQTLRKALELEPHNKTVQDELSTMMKKHREHEAAQQAMDEKMLENPSSTHKHQAKSAWGLSWKWLLGATAVAIGGIALSVAIYARK
uniref:peptidylprolyl isomerase n=1 Tax=Gouania willdenowi TaxID=441366 RepID=A0A8C5DI58_GOUWI